MTASDGSRASEIYRRAAEVALDAPVIAGAFFVDRSDDRPVGSASPRGWYGVYRDIRNVISHLLRRRRLGAMPHWRYLAVTDGVVAILEIHNEPAPVARVVRSSDRAAVVATAGPGPFDIDVDLSDGDIPMSAADPSAEARRVVQVLTGTT